MRHVGDMHAHLPQVVAKLTYGQRIIKVLCIFRVYGECGNITEVLTLLVVLLRNLTRNLVGSLLYLLRIFIRQTVLREYGVHLHIVVARLAENVNHLTDDVLVLLRRPCTDLHHRLVACGTTLELVLRDYYVVGEDVAIANEEGKSLVNTQLAHKRVVSPLQNLRHHGLLDMVDTARHIGNSHPVAGKGEKRVALRHEDWFAAIVRNETVLAVSLPDELAFLHMTFHVQLIRAVADLAEEVVPRHLVDSLHGQHLSRVRVEFKTFEYLFQTKSPAGVVHEEILHHEYHFLFCKILACLSFPCHSIILPKSCLELFYLNI